MPVLERYRSEDLGKIQRMSRVAIPGFSQAVQLGHHRPHGRIPLPMRPIDAPRSHDNAGAVRQALQVIVVLLADRIGGGLHVDRIRGPEGEQVRHTKCAVTP